MQNWKFFARSSDWDFLLLNSYLRLKTLYFFIFSHVYVFMNRYKRSKEKFKDGEYHFGIVYFLTYPSLSLLIICGLRVILD